MSEPAAQPAPSLQRTQSVLDACGVTGEAVDVERLKGQSHISFRVSRRDAPPVALRIEPKRGILPPYDLPSEARLLGQLQTAGVPVPEVLGVCDDLGLADAGRCAIALEWVEGEALIRGQATAEQARAYCDVLRQIHGLDWRAAGLDWLPIAAQGPALREREEIAGRLRHFGVDELPHIRRLRAAVESRAPSVQPPMLVHGDVNFGNVILDCESQRIAAVLDWEQAHLGDPLSDWGRLIAEDLLGNLDLSSGARAVLYDTLALYRRSRDDLHYWSLHQLYKHSSATGALIVLRGWDVEAIGAMYSEPTERLLAGDGLWPGCI